MGKTISHYRIVKKLGAGGMGEVYQATDEKLGRDVAIKVLPDAFVHDPGRLARFQREAQLLASLNHPNIAAIHGLEEADGFRFLVLELVPGKTLAEHCVSGPLPVEEALDLCRQTAEALEAAHEKGIIHRDLKPSNIKVTPEGKVKVLDFGLAKAFAGDGPATDMSHSPTVSVGGTREGILLGTAAYMSPEQARAKPLDKRTDIWAFGCVLYETLTGRQAFVGETISDTIAKILEHEPNWEVLPTITPPNIRVLLRRSLQKDRNQRLHDIADARIEIEDTLRQWTKGGSPTVTASVAGWRWILGIAALGCALLGALITWLAIRPGGPTQASVPQLTSVGRLTHDPEFSEAPTWSPDGSLLAFASNRSGNFEIYVRRVEGGQEVNVTNDPSQDIQPAFSPDGNRIAFVSTRSSRTGMIKTGSSSPIGAEFRTFGGDIWVVPALGGQAYRLAKDGNFPVWHPAGGRVAYVSGPENHRSILEVSAEGGTPRPLLASESSTWEIVRVQYSPGLHWITFETYDTQILILPTSGGIPRKLLDGLSHTWDPSGKRLYYCSHVGLAGTRLQSVEIDETTGKLKGKPQTVGLMTGILRDLAISRDGQHLALSELEGSLNLTRLPLTATGGSPAGPEEVLSRGQVFDHYPAVSPDGGSIAYGSDRLGTAELWILHLDTKRLDRLQLPGRDLAVTGPHWFPDGQRLVVNRSLPDGKESLWLVTGDGSHAEELMTSSSLLPGSEGFPVSPDGHRVMCPARVGEYYQLFSFDFSSHQMRQFTFSADDKFSGSWSPDGRWLVYSSNAGGSVQLWKMPAAGGKPEQLTKGDDRIRHMFYSSNGRWIYFQPNHQNIYRIPATGGRVEQVTHFPESGLYIEEPTISPDGRYLVYCRSNGGSSLWLFTLSTDKSGSD